MAASEDNVKALTEITGLEEGPASNLLAAYSGNLEGAINAFFENPEGVLNPDPPVVVDGDSDSEPTAAAAAAARSGAIVDDDDNVRAPIPRKTEILLPQIETNRARIGKRRGAVITEVPFRNFELEGRIQEQMLMQQNLGPSAKKITRLEALFMPPFDILFSGGFDMAQRHGRSVDRWLLVNLQDDLNFSCQTLNRDLWSDAHLKEFMRRHLVFWQQSNKTTDGAKFKTFYKVRSEPYLGMIDPRTGEEVRNFSSSDLTSPGRFVETLKAFLVENKSPHGKEVNVNQEYTLGMGPSTSSASANGSKSFGGAATSTSASAGSSGQGGSGGSSGKPSSAATSSGASRNRWVTVIDDDEDDASDFQEITDSESDSEDDSKPAAATAAPVLPSSAESPKKSRSPSSKLSKAAGITISAASLLSSMPLIDYEPDTKGETVPPGSSRRAAAPGANNKQPEAEPWEADEEAAGRKPVSPPVALSSDSESTQGADPKTRILLKMPGNVTERLFFRSSRTLERAMAKLRQKYERHFPCNSADAMDVRFFCQAIKADLASLEPHKTLMELKIHPNAVIHVTTDD